MNEYQFIFDYNGSEVFSGNSNELSAKFVIDGGDVSLIEWTTYTEPDPEPNESYAGYYFGTPTPQTQNFIRIPTTLTLDDAGQGVWLTDEHNGIRLKVRLTHTGIHNRVAIEGFQKAVLNEHGETEYVNMWVSTQGVVGEWDTGSKDCYLAIYHGYVDYRDALNIPSILMQLLYFDNGSYTYASGTTCWQINLFNPLPNPEHTYEPNNTVIIGGRGNGNYPSDDAETPNTATRNSLFSFGSGSGRGLTYYITTIEDLIKAFTKIYSSSYINEEARINAMIDAFKIPNITIGTQNIMKFWIADINVDVNTSYIMTTRFVEVPLGNVDLSQYGWDDYNDFKNTRATLYLPFVGRINISMDAIARGSIRVLALLDRYTGNVAYWIYTRSMQAEREVLYGVYEGQSAIQIPFGGSHMVNFMGKFTAMASIFAGGVVAGISGNPIGAGLAGLALVSQAPKALEVGVDTSHAISSTGAATTPYQVRLDIERREMLRPEQYREFASIPAFVTLPLGSMTGFVKIHTADYSGLKCEQSEKELIKEMLEEGVYV